MAPQDQEISMKVYRYFTGKDDVNFCARVTKALNEGYELYGAPTMTFNGTDVIVGQVVITEVSDDRDSTGIKRCIKSVIQCIF